MCEKYINKIDPNLVMASGTGERKLTKSSSQDDRKDRVTINSQSRQKEDNRS